MRQPWLEERRGGVLLLTLNDPETRNALAGEDLFAGLERIVQEVNADVAVRAVVLTGSGSAFSSGGNVREMRDREGMFQGDAEELAERYRGAIQRVPRALATLDVPIVAAVNGPAMGAGCDLACMCDIRWASDRAVFAESFVRLGIIAGDGGTWFLPRVVGWSKAAEMGYTGESLDASQALACGLVSRVVPHDMLVDETVGLAARIASNPPLAVRGMKALFRESAHGSLESTLELAATLQGRCHQTEDHREAIAALFEKRAGVYRGR